MSTFCLFGILSVDILSVRHFVCSTFCLFDILSVDILSVGILSAHHGWQQFLFDNKIKFLIPAIKLKKRQNNEYKKITIFYLVIEQFLLAFSTNRSVVSRTSPTGKFLLRKIPPFFKYIYILYHKS